MSQFDVDVQAEVPLSEGLPGLVEQAAVATLNHQGVASPAGLTILLTGDAHVQQLNRDFLGEDRPTDVLSFPAGDPLPAQAGEMAGYLGDVAIALPTAGRQAAAAGHSLAAELQLLTVHGVLHLLGFDHAGPTEKAAMWAAQSAILTVLGTEITTPPLE